MRIITRIPLSHPTLSEKSPTLVPPLETQLCFGSLGILSSNVYTNLENLWTEELDAFVL